VGLGTSPFNSDDERATEDPTQAFNLVGQGPGRRRPRLREPAYGQAVASVGASCAWLRAVGLASPGGLDRVILVRLVLMSQLPIGAIALQVDRMGAQPAFLMNLPSGIA
jgi:hypothetical protein